MNSDINKILGNHEDRIVKLEKNDIEKEIRLQKVEDSYLRLENTIMTENRETREILRESMQKQWDLIKTRDDKKDAENARDYEFRKSRLERQTELLIKIMTIGGVGYLILQSALDYFTK